MATEGLNTSPTAKAQTKAGEVWLIGAGPGRAELLTIRAAQCIAAADVIIYDGLVNPACFESARPDATFVYAGKKKSDDGHAMSQEDIGKVMVEHAGRGKSVARVKSGDPLVFGRVAEECQVLAKAGIPFEIVPGVSSATGALAYAGIPLTGRGASSSVALITGHIADNAPLPADWPGASADTIVMFMSIVQIDACVQKLLQQGLAPDLPAAIIARGTQPEQQVHVATLRELPEVVAKSDIRPPALVVIGSIVSAHTYANWLSQKPLAGRRVVLLRSRQDAKAAARALADAGAEVLCLPITHVVAENPPPVADWESVDCVAFTSRHGVDYFFDWLGRHGLDARILHGKRLVCVGEQTAKALATKSLCADVIGQAGGADLGARLVGLSPPPRRVLFPRAAQGRDELVQVLSAGGVAVDVLPCYRTIGSLPENPYTSHVKSLLLRGRVDAVFVFAPSQWHALRASLGSGLPESTRFFAIGKTTAEALVADGVKNVKVCAQPDPQVLAETLL